MKTVTVNASKKYDVLIGTGFLGDTGPMIHEKIGGQTAAIVTDDIVSALYAEQLKNSLSSAGYNVLIYEFPNGEGSKNTNTFLSLINFFATNKLNRTDIVIALGGGVTGDIAGFAASSYKRGLRLIQIPTTLLAAVDSSVGGKTAVNLTAGKNLLGAFYQPDLVLCDTSLLSTLPPEVCKDGCAEAIKYGVIADSELFNSIKHEESSPLLASPLHSFHDCTTPLEDIIYNCVKIKRDIVSEDEFEHGSRKLLNFGHTIGHAIELLSDYSISHGYAVAIGMAIETRAALSLGICEAQCLNDILKILDLYELPSTTSYNAKELAKACLFDKKRDGDSIIMVFPEKIGKCVLKEIPINEVEALIRQGMGGTI